MDSTSYIAALPAAAAAQAAVAGPPQMTSTGSRMGLAGGNSTLWIVGILAVVFGYVAFTARIGKG